MGWLVIALLVLLAASCWLNYVVIGKNLALNDQREELVDQIEESLDMLDTCYSRLAHHSSIPVLSDEPIIQEVVRDIKLAKNTVLAVASKVATYSLEDNVKAQASDEP
jgi:hypothetical protein